MDKKFTFGLIALLGVSLFILGCDDSSDDAGPSNEEKAATLVEALGTDIAELDPADSTKTTVILKAPMTAAKAIDVQSGVTFKTGTNALMTSTFTVSGRAIVGGTMTSTGAITVTGKLLLAEDQTLTTALNISGSGQVALIEGKAITLGHASAKIAGASWDITPESGEVTGTVGASGTGTAIGFGANGIVGLDNTSNALAGGTVNLLSDVTATDPAAAVLTLGTADSELKIKGATSVLGVIIDVATKGKIIVAKDQVLTLGLGKGTGHKASGGIFTVVVAASTAGGAVKANAFEPDGSTGVATAASLAGGKVEAAATGTVGGDLGTGAGSPAPAAADATITGGNGAGTTIDAADTFAVTAGVVAVTSGS
jgi:hypothetical protein